MSTSNEQSHQEPQISNETSQRRVARVKWFNSKTGFGFVTDTQSAEDLFVHHSGITVPENVYRYLMEGEYIEYDVKLDTKGQRCATDVTGIGRGPLLCQCTRNTSNYNEHSSSSTSTNSDTSTQRGERSGRGSRGGRGRGGRGKRAN
jgi:CspA family cold shock protein